MARVETGLNAKRSPAPSNRRMTASGAKETRGRLLTAAAHLFADRGFQAVSIREIAKEAGVNSALVNYYFGSKDALFEEVIRLYTVDHIAYRLERLSTERRRKNTLSLEDLLAIYLEPLIFPEAENADRALFARLHAVMLSEKLEVFEDIASRSFNALNLAFIDELQRCLPHLQRETIIWRLFSIIGSMLFLDIQPAPPSLLVVSAGRCDTTNRHALYQNLMPFFVAGMRAPLAED